ncbi:MAG: hypothetical protein INR65_12205 [Gluconacetobacter diazotrophicus]|nr:hypothetical protein [Gluconacetobacter diazotrophicus]
MSASSLPHSSSINRPRVGTTINRTLLAAAAVGLAATAYRRPPGEHGTLVPWGQDPAAFALSVLLAVAGYRVAVRADATGDARRMAGWLLARALPGLWAGIGVLLLVVGPLETWWHLRGYVGSVHTRIFAENLLLRQRPFLTGVFLDSPRRELAAPVVWSFLAGALGSLPVLATAGTGTRARLGSFGAAALACGAAGWALSGRPPVIVWGADAATLLYGIAFFAAGTATHAALGHEAVRFRFDAAVLCFAADALGVWWLGAACLPMLWLTVPYMAVTAARAYEGAGGQAVDARRADPSLGMLLLGLPMLQVTAERWAMWPGALLGALVLATGWGFLSWFAVERSALGWWAARGERPWTR